MTKNLKFQGINRKKKIYQTIDWKEKTLQNSNLI